MGTLYIVGTPIGNLGDFSPRAIEILKTVDFIAAEDTRVTLKLLNHFEIRNTLISYHEHNAATRGPELLERLLNGENGAIVTDAGMPCISDPGEGLVALCHENEVEIATVPGPTAAMTALAASGLPTDRFLFEGFLPVNRKQKKERLADLLHEKRTVIFYEAPHKLRTTLDDLTAAFGPERSITLCRELTKLHEEMQRTTLAAAVAEYAEREPRGEYVLIVAGAGENDHATQMTLEQAAALVRRLAGEGQSLSDAAKQVAKETGYRKGDLYRLALKSE